MSLHSSFKIELKRFITISVVIVVMIASQFWLWKYVALSANELQEKRTQEDQLRNLQDRIMAVDSTYDNQQALLDQLEVIFPNKGSTSQAVERLEHLAEQEQVALEIKSISETEKDKLVELEVAVTAVGPALFLFQYIDAVEHVSELTRIEQWTLEPVVAASSEEETTFKNYTLTMQVVFYMQANNNGN